MMGILDSHEKKALKNRARVEEQIRNLKERLEKFSHTNQSDKEKEEIYAIMAEIEELNAMISIN